MQVIAFDRDERLSLQAVRPLADFVQQVRIEIVQTPTDRAEAETVVHQIEQMVGGTATSRSTPGRVRSEPETPGPLPILPCSISLATAEPAAGRGLRALWHSLSARGPDAARRTAGCASCAGLLVAACSTGRAGAPGDRAWSGQGRFCQRHVWPLIGTRGRATSGAERSAAGGSHGRRLQRDAAAASGFQPG